MIIYIMDNQETDLKMMQRMLPTEYIQGYTAALLDVLECLECVKSDLKHHKKPFNAKNMKRMIDCMVESRAILREEPDCFVRYNGTKDDFEIFKRNR